MEFEIEKTDLSTFKRTAIRKMYNFTNGDIQFNITYDPNTRLYYPYIRNIATGKQILLYKKCKSSMDGKTGWSTLNEAKAQLTNYSINL